MWVISPLNSPGSRMSMRALPSLLNVNGCVFAYSIEASQLSKLCGINVVTLDLILKIPSPIDVHRASDMSGVVKQNIFIALDDPVRRIV
jgi:hypothetical protein